MPDVGRALQTVIEDLDLPNPVIRSHHRNGFIKQYVRDHLLLRTSRSWITISHKYTGQPYPTRGPAGCVALVIGVEKVRYTKLPFAHTPPTQ